MKYDLSWQKLPGSGDRKYLYVRPTVSVADNDWINFFEARYANYEADTALMLIDVAEAEDQIGREGFSGIINCMQKNGVNKVRLAVMPSNEYYPLLVNLLSKLADKAGLDLQAQLFLQYDSAKTWLAGQ